MWVCFNVCLCVISLNSDLVIGAFESRQVFVLRSRTVVVIATNITTNVNVIRITSDSEKECELNGIRYNW